MRYLYHWLCWQVTWALIRDMLYNLRSALKSFMASIHVRFRNGLCQCMRERQRFGCPINFHGKEYPNTESLWARTAPLERRKRFASVTVRQDPGQDCLDLVVGGKPQPKENRYLGRLARLLWLASLRQLTTSHRTKPRQNLDCSKYGAFSVGWLKINSFWTQARAVGDIRVQGCQLLCEGSVVNIK